MAEQEKAPAPAAVSAAVPARPPTTGATPAAPATAPPRTWRFWMVFFSLCMTSLSTSLDSTVVTTSLPTIVRDIGGADQYVWIGNSFLLSSTVVQPLVGQLADIFGRRWPMLTSLALFALGSGIAGGANGVAMLIAGRTVQGLGCGGIYVLLDIITCDMVPVRERGKFLGLVLSTGAIGSTLGPIIGGALAEADWRWVFYLTVPTSGLAMVFLFFFLNVNYAADPEGRRALARVDYAGTAIFVASITSVLLAVVMGDAVHPWSSWRIIVPLVLGFLGWGAFHVFEASPLCRNPSVPRRLFANRTSFVGFVLALDSAALLMWVVTFLPVYFQGVLRTSPLQSGVNLLPLSVFMIPSAAVVGGVMSKIGKFKPLQHLGFGVSAVGMGLLSTLDSGSHRAEWVCYQIVTAFGVGAVLTTVLPGIQSALSERDQAAATAMFSFMRSFGFVWGITVPAVVFNGQFDRHIGAIADPAVRDNLADGRAYGFVSGGYIGSLAPETADQVVATYTKALATVWQVAIAFSLLGFALVFAEKHYELRKELDTEYGLKEGEVAKDAEQGGLKAKDSGPESNSELSPELSPEGSVKEGEGVISKKSVEA